MKWAVDGDGKRVTATKGAKGCVEPGSEWPVIAKCGRIVVHHWARKPGGVPDPWSEPETPWHREWKERLVPDSHQEWTFNDDKLPSGYHRADAIGKGGVVVEFQHSSISVDEIEAREHFYLRHAAGLVWVFDARTWHLDIEGTQIRWRYPRKTLWHVACPMFLDTGKGLIKVTNLVAENKCYFTPDRWTYEQFIEAIGLDEGEEPCDPQPGGKERGPTPWDHAEVRRFRRELAEQKRQEARAKRLRLMAEQEARREAERKRQAELDAEQRRIETRRAVARFRQQFYGEVTAELSPEDFASRLRAELSAEG